MPTTKLDAESCAEGMGIIDIMIACNLAKSKSEARQLIKDGGISVDGEKIADLFTVIGKDRLEEGIKIKKGKKVWHRAVIG